jgi:hypothetical protein
MRTYNELVIEFSTWGSEEKQKWIDELPIEEIKVLINGLSNVAYTGIWDSWIKYMEMIILTKIEEERARKLKELGI